MGYTHYWTQTRNMTAEEWETVRGDVGEILKYTQHISGIPLANGIGDPGTQPEIASNKIWFNGVGPDNDHETFGIVPTIDGPAWAFCKTARKPYDVAVAACLCYLSTCLEPAAYTVSSDGNGSDFIEGLEVARKALPRKANILDIPRGVMESDRWTGPWLSVDPESTGYSVHFCINGKAYVERQRCGRTSLFNAAKPAEVYCFPTHLALGEFLEQHKVARFKSKGRTRFGDYGSEEPDIWHATGSFDQARHDRIALAQSRVLATLFPVPPARVEAPPAFVRPMEFPRPEDNGTFCYSLDELLKAHAAI